MGLYKGKAMFLSFPGDCNVAYCNGLVQLKKYWMKQNTLLQINHDTAFSISPPLSLYKYIYANSAFYAAALYLVLHLMEQYLLETFLQPKMESAAENGVLQPKIAMQRSKKYKSILCILDVLVNCFHVHIYHLSIPFEKRGNYYLLLDMCSVPILCLCWWIRCVIKPSVA